MTVFYFNPDRTMGEKKLQREEDQSLCEVPVAPLISLIEVMTLSLFRKDAFMALS